MPERLNVKALLRKHGLRPKKSWSQNFLVDLDSKHGTLVSGKPVQRHMLEMEPVFTIDPYTLVFNKIVSPAAETPGEEEQPEAKSEGEKGHLKTVGT